MPIGISTACFYPNLTENSVAFLAESGIKLIEIFFNSRSETNIRYLSKLKPILDSYHMNVIAVHSFFCAYEPYLIFSDYERRFDDCLPYADALFDAGSFLGAKYAIIHGGKDSGNISSDKYFERFNTLYNRGIEIGVQLAQENVNLYKSSRPEFIAEMRNSLKDNVAFVLDVKQCIRAGVEINDMVNAMGNRLVHIHLSDNNAENDCMLPFNGSFDFYSFLNSNEIIKRATKVIELYNSAYFSREEVIESVNKLNKLINE